MDLCGHRLRLDGAGAVVSLDEAFVRGFVTRWVEAWNAHDADGLLALCTPEAVWTDPSLPEPAVGPENVRAFLAETWAIFPDLTFRLIASPLIATGGPEAAQLWRMSGTFLGPSPPGFAPTGKRVEQDGIDLYTFRDDLVTDYRTLYDVAETARQMGLAPPRGSRVEHTMAFVQRAAMKLRRT